MGERDEFWNWDAREFWAIENNEDLHTVKTQKLLRDRQDTIIEYLKKEPQTVTDLEKKMKIHKTAIQDSLLKMMRKKAPIDREKTKFGYYYRFSGNPTE